MKLFNNIFSRIIFYSFNLFLLFGWFIPDLSNAATWLLIDTKEAVISVMKNTRPILKLKNISIGRGGVDSLHIKDDDKTPTGEFKITRINRDSQYRRFFEINYPTPDHAKLALKRGIIDGPTYSRILQSQLRFGHPPLDTPLGGYLGIHGLGGGDPKIHNFFNWTNGCIAVNNTQIDKLSDWIQLGMKVVIK